MAPLWTRWLLFVFLVDLPNCFSSAVLEGPPAPPSLFECYIPCDQKRCLEHIHCTWDQSQEHQIPTNYSLHWEQADSEEGRWINGSSLSRLILREHFSYHGELRVWVQAKNQHGSAKSQDLVFNTADIIKPPPPNVTSCHQEALEISWNSPCAQLHLSLGFCDVRYRTKADQVRFKEEGGFYGSYTSDSLQPCTTYEFQVRCACRIGLSSDWSAILRVQGPETTPAGELDVWMDCGIFPTSLDCFLIWKKLPVSQACGLILGYEVRLSYNNGSAALVNVSTAELRDQLLCEEMQCLFTSSLKDTSSVSVSAYNAHGATVASYLAMPSSGKEKNQALRLRMHEENLTVSWDPPSQLSDDPKKYVVQYKQAGSPPGQSFDWVKVNESQTTAFFKGQFKKYTPYQVSLLTVSHRGDVHHLLSVIGYSLQRIPSRVPSLKVFSIAATYVTLLWEPIPLSEQDGMILYYQIGLDSQPVYNVSAFPQHENKTLQLWHLSPGQEYEVWIRAVTAAGRGEKATMLFATKHQEYFGYLSVLIGVICLFGICLLVLTGACCGESKAGQQLFPCYCGKVPDPRNSHIFGEMKHQVSDSMAWICNPVNEPHPKISLLEIVDIQPWASKSSPEKTSNADGVSNPVVRGGTSHVDCQNGQREDAVTEECHRTDHKYGREAYSKMVDSDEEREREDGWSSSEEEECTSEHFQEIDRTSLSLVIDLSTEAKDCP